jgi:hypothetical protein
MTDRQDPIPAGAIRHGECGRWWTGVARAHCPSCHEVFSCDSAAERHRVGPTGARQCASPGTVGLIARGMPFGVLWGWPGPEGAELRTLRTGATS